MGTQTLSYCTNDSFFVSLCFCLLPSLPSALCTRREIRSAKYRDCGCGCVSVADLLPKSCALCLCPCVSSCLSYLDIYRYFTGSRHYRSWRLARTRNLRPCLLLSCLVLPWQHTRHSDCGQAPLGIQVALSLSKIEPGREGERGD